jgi:hypothetical protein
MDRLISLFREASDDARARPPDLPSEPGLGGQPVYFVQLMEYLRQQKREAELAAADADGDCDGIEDDEVVVAGGRDVIGCDFEIEIEIDEEDADMLIGSTYAAAHR